MKVERSTVAVPTFLSPSPRVQQQGSAVGQPQQESSFVGSTPRRLLRQLNRNPELRAMYDAMSGPERAELDDAFRRYDSNVARRTDQGWSHGLVGNFGTNRRNQGQIVVGSMRSNEQARPALVSAVEQANARVRENPNDPAAIAELRRARQALGENTRALGMAQGRCGDWQEETRDLFREQGYRHFTPGAATRPGHTAAVLSLGGDPNRTIVFDPWKHGEPEVLTYRQWSHRSLGRFGGAKLEL